MRRSVLVPVVAGATLILGLVGRASAETVEYTDDIPLMSTNWAEMVSIPLFDPSLGELLSVSFELVGHAEGSARFESLDNASATVTMSLAAEVELQRPDSTPLVSVLPLVNTSDDVTAFDGVIDFAGTSGRSYDGLEADDSDGATTSDADDLLLFTGVGNIDLPVVAMGASTGSGAGNLILQFATSASAGIKVIYEYDVPVPTLDYSWGRIKSDYR